MQSLSEYYHRTHPAQPFTLAFLDSRNITALQRALTERALANPHVPRTVTVPFSDGFLGALMDHATKRATFPTNEIPAENAAFVHHYSAPIIADFIQNKVWMRWAEHGFPNPNEVPLPTPPPLKQRRADVDGSAYLTTKPVWKRSVIQPGSSRLFLE